MKGRVLTIAGSDSGGGAGIQADIKTITALGGFAMTAVTALTAQNTQGVQAVLPTPPEFVGRQIDAVLEDLGADCLKTGMLHDAGIIAAAAERIERASLPLVVDPVMVASTGRRLLDADAVTALTERLIARATVLTPNLPEVEVLTGIAAMAPDDMRRAGERLRRLGPKTVVVKGGHLPGDTLVDLLLDEDGELAIETRRVPSRGTHGTGCSMAAAIATGLAQGMTVRDAFRRAHRFVQAAIAHAPGYGKGGNGPLDHSHAIPPYASEK
jgi:hydroxymethylpyrimidine/phosphomethylpyrimidine kinase